MSKITFTSRIVGILAAHSHAHYSGIQAVKYAVVCKDAVTFNNGLTLKVVSTIYILGYQAIANHDGF